MVAPHHPSFRPAGTRPLDFCADFRRMSPSDGRSVFDQSELLESPGSADLLDSGRRERRPQLRLVVDNTDQASLRSVDPAARRVDRGADLARRRAADGGGESTPLATVAVELGAWLASFVRLVGARWRLTRQRWINRYGRLGLLDRATELGPRLVLIGVMIFGGLFVLRVAQESSSADAAGSSAVGAATVAAISASTSSTPLAASISDGPDSVVVVHAGDSLWSIAGSRFPEHDARHVVDAFVEVNGGSAIHSGQQLVVPPSLLEG